jgi:hypothetical protein
MERQEKRAARAAELHKRQAGYRERIGSHNTMKMLFVLRSIVAFAAFAHHTWGNPLDDDYRLSVDGLTQNQCYAK